MQGVDPAIVEGEDPADANPAITMAIVLAARDLYDAGEVKERRTAAERLIDRFAVRYP